MDDPSQWHLFFDAFGDFLARFGWGWRIILALSVPFLVWKFLDAWGKRKKD